MKDEPKLLNDETLRRLIELADKIKDQSPFHPCPNCGRCPTCGRGGYPYTPTYPYTYTPTGTPDPYTPTYPYQPFWTTDWNGTRLGENLTITADGYDIGGDE